MISPTADRPRVILDGAHNPHGAAALAAELAADGERPLAILAVGVYGRPLPNARSKPPAVKPVGGDKHGGAAYVMNHTNNKSREVKVRLYGKNWNLTSSPGAEWIVAAFEQGGRWHEPFLKWFDSMFDNAIEDTEDLPLHLQGESLPDHGRSASGPQSCGALPPHHVPTSSHRMPDCQTA
jgi:hypothetical protein